MRHGKKFNHLSRTAPHRKAMLANMASSLIDSKRITTTVAKAKALRTYIEPLITKSKEDTTHNRRSVFSYLQNKEAVKELFDEVSAKIADRPGGYTRIIKLGSRLGDDAEMALIELVDYNELMSGESAEKKKAATTTRRSRRGGSKAKATETTDAEVKEEKTEKKAPKKAAPKKDDAKVEAKSEEKKAAKPAKKAEDTDKDKEGDA
jgi:large subunit ribosomal protein L17